MLKKEKQKAADGVYRTDDVRASVMQNRRPDQQQPLVSNGNGDSNNSRVSRENEKGRVWTMDNNNYSRTDSDVKAKKICEWFHVFLYIVLTNSNLIIILTSLIRKSGKRCKRHVGTVGEMSVGRQEAFEIFRRDYEHNQTIEDNKAVLRQRYAEAKTLGEQVNNCRTSISKLQDNLLLYNLNRLKIYVRRFQFQYCFTCCLDKVKGNIEQHRVALAMKGFFYLLKQYQWVVEPLA